MKGVTRTEHQADGDAGYAPQLDCSMSVNAVVAHFPSTFRIFNRFGIDLCCGGALSVEQAARAEGVDERALCGALHEALFV